MVGNSASHNHNYVKEYNLYCPPIPNAGGCIIASPNDVQIAYIKKYKPEESNLHLEILNKIANYYKIKQLNPIIFENDMMIDNYKCASCSSKRFDDMMLYTLHISINVDLDLIKKICTKPMYKVPKGLSDYGITTQEIVDYISYNI